MEYTFSHVGIPHKEEMADEELEEHLKVYITPLEEDAMRFEFVRFIPETRLPESIAGQIHIGYEVPDIDRAVSEGDEILMSVTDIGDKRIAFIRRKGIIVELIENSESG